MKKDMDILIVEDSTTQTVLLVETLRVGGYETQTAADGRQALESIRRNRPALIVSDICMPVMDGFELCRTIKQDPRLRGIPVILLTSLVAPTDVLSALEAGADFYVPKPYQGESLLQAIDTLLKTACESAEEETGTTGTVVINGVARQIVTSPKQMVKLLIATYEIAVQQNKTLRQEREVIQALNETLEEKVRERTASLTAEIVKRKQLEEYRELGMEVLRTLNAPGDFKASISHILLELLARTGTYAVGLRLQDGEDFPYFSDDGFPADFLLTENTLVERGPDGGLCRDKDGKVCLECTCGLVISGKTDPSNPLFTQGGSFWTNDSFQLLDLPPEQDPRHHPRNECIHQGYASVALIPIKAKSMIVGLLHLCSREKGCFSPATIEFLEGIAAHIGEALTRKLAEEALKISEKEFRSLAESMPQIVWIARADGWINYFNQQWVAYTGLTLEESYGHGWNTPFHPDDRQRAWDAWKNATEKDAPYFLDCRLQRADGTYRWWLVRGMPLRDAEGKILKWFGTYTDIEHIKQVEIQRANQLRELQRSQDVMLGREHCMMELKHEINEFCLRSGEATRYPSQEEASVEA